MGLKHGLAAKARKESVFVSLSKKDGHPYSLAEVGRSEDKFFLQYPDGRVGTLVMGGNRQLELFFITLPPVWVPTEKQKQAIEGVLPKHHILFEGDYIVSEQSSDFLPPPARHTSDAERFEKPVGVWEKCVAYYLNREPPPVVN
jgi:hypothetical protein